MAKKTVKKKPAAALAKVEPVAPVAPKLELDVKLTHSPNYKQAMTFRDNAVNLVISDKASHVGALAQVKEGKTLRKSAVEFFKKTKQAIDRVKNAVLDLEKEELGILDAGLTKAEATVVAWVNAENARIEAADNLKREAAERKAREDREAEIKKQEQEVERLEAESPNLSAGELWFVTQVVENEIEVGAELTVVDSKRMNKFAKDAGYADPEKTVARFLKSQKMLDAIATAREIKAKTEQARALREEPLEPVTFEKTESEVGKVAGTHMTKSYSCGGIRDLAKLRAAYMAGDLDEEAFEPNMVVLNREAKQLEAKFEQVYPGAILKKTEGVAG